ncbi:MAG: HAD family hydrolase [Candidatus Pacebacteria bacterium]|nr:HAD family hydrolase [Candidatus Paceibacterota bacterium]
MKKIKTAIFDMDGTLYQIDGSATGYKDSSLEKEVNKNALKFILDAEGCSQLEAESILQEALQDEIGISSFLSERYQITREDYFNTIWDISPVGIVKNFETAIQIVNQMKELDLTMILLTAAPTVWQKAVIEYLELMTIFDEIYTADSFKNKGEIFKQLAQRFSPSSSISIGDQVESDIKPAEELGFLTLLVNSPNDLTQLLQMIKG